ncbi:MAG: ubiquinol oxidase subunit II [Simkaniaceae bacterium]|nr:ubiquinol oxidase subunit II [Simkaniaceae bacterium]MCF7852827.1 ubiquinol oxidase subunit II [Simkaniaceae bacterium]
MNKKFKFTFLLLSLFAMIAVVVLYVVTHKIAVLDPKGFIADKQRDLIIIASLLMLIVVIPVFVMTILFAWKYHHSNDKAKYTPDWDHHHVAELVWWGLPFAIIIVLAVLVWKTSHELNPFRPIESDKKTIAIQVVALDWKWLFIYPEQKVASVNFVAIPQNTPVEFEITADAPMNSFWVPQLAGQIYAMPAMRTKLNVIANECGSYRGSSSNLSGKGFAGMVFTVEAMTENQFDQWVQTAQDSNRALTAKSYEELAEPSEYNPIETYTLEASNLFEHILDKYTVPPADLQEQLKQE